MIDDGLGSTTGAGIANMTITTTAGDPINTSGNNLYYWHPSWYPWAWSYLPVQPVEPTTCLGKAHVFDCDHVKTCKCGAITRVIPPRRR